MPRRKTRRRGGSASAENFIADLEQTIRSGQRPSEAAEMQLHERAAAILSNASPQVRSRISKLMEDLNNLPKTGGADWNFPNWQTEVEKHAAAIEAMLPSLSALRSREGVGPDVQGQLREQVSPHIDKLGELLDDAPTEDRRTRAVATRVRSVFTRGQEAMRAIGARRRKTRRRRSRLN